jgi:hypothetical protein
MDNWYKRWMYHEKLKPEGKIIHTPEELAALGPGWVDTPGKFGTVPLEDPPPAPPESRPQLTLNPLAPIVAKIVAEEKSDPPTLPANRPRKNK